MWLPTTLVDGIKNAQEYSSTLKHTQAHSSALKQRQATVKRIGRKAFSDGTVARGQQLNTSRNLARHVFPRSRRRG